jgi:putative hydrolase of the HAD superfamily
MPLRGILFDLDDTLFDHDRATGSALSALRATEPVFREWAADELVRRHSVELESMHLEVLAGRQSIDNAREERFRRLFEAAAGRTAPAGHAAHLARGYRTAYEGAWQSVAGAPALLAALRHAGFAIAIVTNNIVAEQKLKLRHCGLDSLIDVLITSEEVGAAKPDVRIFEAALSHLKLTAGQTVMIGDAWQTDIAGALTAGIRPIWFNRKGAINPDPAVTELNAFEPTARAIAVITNNSTTNN